MAATDSPARRILARLRTRPTARAGAGGVLVLIILALLAPLLANEKPLVLRWQGKTYYPAFRDFLSMPAHPDLLAAGFRDLPTFKAGLDAARGDSLLLPPIPWSPVTLDLAGRYALPFEGSHPLGADDVGRDVAARLLHGARVSLAIGLIAAGLAFLIGFVAGSAAGYLGGWADIGLSRLMEIVDSIPKLLLLLVLVAALERPTLYHTMAIIGVTSWTGIARILRGEVLKLRGRDFVAAARGLGSGGPGILLRHILPNALGPVVVALSFAVASAILAESMLSFLGFGDPNFPSWGEIIEQGRNHMRSWHLVVFPGVAVFATVTAFNLLGDALRDAIDPRLAPPA